MIFIDVPKPLRSEVEYELIIRQVLANTPIAGVVFALVGGFIVKILEHRQKVKEAKLSDGARIREELRKSLGESRDELSELKREEGEWRAKYWDEVSDHSETKARLSSLLTTVIKDPEIINHLDPEEDKGA